MRPMIIDRVLSYHDQLMLHFNPGSATAWKFHKMWNPVASFFFSDASSLSGFRELARPDEFTITTSSYLALVGIVIKIPFKQRSALVAIFFFEETWGVIPPLISFGCHCFTTPVGSTRVGLPQTKRDDLMHATDLTKQGQFLILGDWQQQLITLSSTG